MPLVNSHERDSFLCSDPTHKAAQLHPRGTLLQPTTGHLEDDVSGPKTSMSDRTKIQGELGGLRV